MRDFVSVVFCMIIRYLRPGITLHGMCFPVFIIRIEAKASRLPDTQTAVQVFLWLPNPLSGRFLYRAVSPLRGLTPFLWQRRQYASCAPPSCGRGGSGSCLCLWLIVG